jgi:hypothetical protein
MAGQRLVKYLQEWLALICFLTVEIQWQAGP